MTSTATESKRLVQTWVDAPTAEELERRAQRAERSVAAEVRLALREYLERSNIVRIHQPPRGGGEAA